MVESLIALALLLLFLASSVTLGHLVCRALPGASRDGEPWAAELALGLGIYGLLVLIAGLVRILYPAVAWGLLLAPALLWAIPSLRPRFPRPRLPVATVDRWLAVL